MHLIKIFEPLLCYMESLLMDAMLPGECAYFSAPFSRPKSNTIFATVRKKMAVSSWAAEQP